MSDFQIRPASAEAMLALVALCGPPGSGKTLGALTLAHGLGGRVCVLDTEVRKDRSGTLRGRSETYRGLRTAFTGDSPLQFDVLPLEAPYSTERFLDALELIWSNGYDVVVVDSLTHEWFGILDEVDKAGSNTFGGGWKKASPKHEKFVDRIMRAPSHLICTMRSKMAYEIVEENGRKTPKKIGMQPVQREGMEYQFEVILEIDQDHTVRLTKANANYGQQLADLVMRTPRVTSALGTQLGRWLAGGSPPPAVKSDLPDIQVPKQNKETPGSLPETASSTPESLRLGSQPKQAGMPAAGETTAAPGLDSLDFVGDVVPLKLAERVIASAAGTVLTKEEANDFHAYLVDYLGGGEAGGKRAIAAWAGQGVKVAKGVQITREQAIGAARHATTQTVNTEASK